MEQHHARIAVVHLARTRHGGTTTLRVAGVTGAALTAVLQHAELGPVYRHRVTERQCQASIVLDKPPDSNELTRLHSYRKVRRKRRESGEGDVAEKHYINVCVEDVGVDKAEDRDVDPQMSRQQRCQALVVCAGTVRECQRTGLFKCLLQLVTPVGLVCDETHTLRGAHPCRESVLLPIEDADWDERRVLQRGSNGDPRHLVKPVARVLVDREDPLQWTLPLPLRP